MTVIRPNLEHPDNDYSVLPEYVYRMEKLIDALRSGRPVWMRRGNFRDPVWRDIAPKWHILKSRTKVGDYEWVHEAYCEYTIQGTILQCLPDRIGVTVPRKADRCKRCMSRFGTMLQKAAKMEEDSVKSRA